jgi:hypothetical protein
MVTTSRTGWLTGPVSDENGRGAVERILDRSPSVMPVRGFGAQAADITSAVRRQREQIYDLDVTVAEEFGCSADSAESPGSGGRGRIGQDADECAARGPQRYRLHYRLICHHAIGASLPRLSRTIVVGLWNDFLVHGPMLPDAVPGGVRSDSPRRESGFNHERVVRQAEMLYMHKCPRSREEDRRSSGRRRNVLAGRNH